MARTDRRPPGCRTRPVDGLLKARIFRSCDEVTPSSDGLFNGKAVNEADLLIDELEELFDAESRPKNTLEHHVGRFRRTIPATWTEYDSAALAEPEERALFLPSAAGMVERRTTRRLQMFGHPVAVEATITAAGQFGFVEAMAPVCSAMWDEWQELFERRLAGDR